MFKRVLTGIDFIINRKIRLHAIHEDPLSLPNEFNMWLMGEK